MSHLNIILAEVSPNLPAAGSPGTIEIVSVGFLFVMVVLSTLCAVTAVLGAFFARHAAREAVKAAAQAAQKAALEPAAPEVKAVEVAEEEDPLLLAVVAAAVHSVIGDRAHRVVSIRPGGPGWAQEGRRQIFSSHRVR